MDILQAIVLILLCMIILFNLKLPSSVKKIGNVPVTILLLLICFYLFTKSPILGIVGLIAAYGVMQKTSIQTITVQDDPYNEQPAIGDTLEEQMVKNISPMAQQTPTPTYLNFKYTVDSSHNAASCN
jgi:hypothetical protein